MNNTKTPETTPLYVVSMGKFSALYLATMGLYGFYWTYKHWELLGEHQNRTTLPFLRSLLHVVFIPMLAFDLRKFEQEQGKPYPWNPMQVSVVFIISQLITAWVITGIYQGSFGDGWNLIQLPYLFFTYYVLYKMQLVANRLCEDPFGKVNAKFTPINHAWIIYGIVQWLGFGSAMVKVFTAAN